MCFTFYSMFVPNLCPLIIPNTLAMQVNQHLESLFDRFAAASGCGIIREKKFFARDSIQLHVIYYLLCGQETPWSAYFQIERISSKRLAICR